MARAMGAGLVHPCRLGCLAQVPSAAARRRKMAAN